MTMKKKSPSPDQTKLKILSDKVCDDIDQLLVALGIDSYKKLDKMILMSCPIHGGDNDSALNLYYTGDSYRGNWKCRTHQCENTFKSSIIGFIRGRLSHIKYGWENPNDQMVPFQEALNYAMSFANQTLGDIKVSRKELEKNSFVNAVKHLVKPEQQNIPRVKRSTVISGLSIPSKYFLGRNFSEAILRKYDVGDCLHSAKEMSGRAVVPIYDDEHEYMVGCTGRSVQPKCENCNHYHSTDSACPDQYEKYLHKKWRHNKGFNAEDTLYNFWNAKDFIKQTGTVILVESPGNVWRLEEAGIHNSVCLFGSSLKDKQRMLLDTSGAMTIITIMDNDSAGKDGQKSVEDKCKRIYNVKHINIIDYPDVAEMPVQSIIDEIIPQIQRLSQ